MGSYLYLNHLAQRCDILFFKIDIYSHCLCYIHSAECTGVCSALMGKGREGQDGTHGRTRDRQHGNHWIAFIPPLPLHLTKLFLPTKDMKLHHSHWYTLQPPKTLPYSLWGQIYPSSSLALANIPWDQAQENQLSSASPSYGVFNTREQLFLPQSANKSICWALCIERTNISNMKEARHLVSHLWLIAPGRKKNE